MTSVSNPTAIRAMQISAQMMAVRMEARGLKRRGRSMTVMLKEHYKLKRSASREEVLAKLQAERDELDRQLMQGMDNEGEAVQ